MQRAWWLPLVVLAGCAQSKPQEPAAQGSAVVQSADHTPAGYLEVAGKTVPAPGRISEIAAQVMQPVTVVRVKPGDRVQANQPLIELESLEPAAHVRAKRAEVQQLRAALAGLKALPRAEERAKANAQLESAQVGSKAAHELLDHLTALHKRDAVAHRECIEQKTVVLRMEAEERAARAHLDYMLKLPIELDIAEAEARLRVAEAQLEGEEHNLENYTLLAAIDGVVSWLDVTPGSVNRAGTKVFGEIVDLKEVDVRVDMTTKQLAQIDLAQGAQVRQEDGQTWSAQFIFAAPAASQETGLVPVTLRVKNSEADPLRCYLNVKVRFKQRTEGSSATAALPTRVAAD